MFALLSLALAQATKDTAPAVLSDFPKDIPVYKGAKVQTWDDKSPIKVLYLEVTADKADIMAFYKRELAAKGWKVGKAFGGSLDALQAVMGNRVISMACWNGTGW